MRAYDLTNQATLRLQVGDDYRVVDLCWGTVLTAIAVTLGYRSMSASTVGDLGLALGVSRQRHWRRRSRMR